MAATGVNLNWSSVTMASTTVSKITSAGHDAGGNFIDFSGDTNIYPIVKAAAVHNPTFTFTTGDVGTVENMGIGTTGTFVATLADAKAQTGGGVVFTGTTNATITNIQSNGQHGQYASSTVTIGFISSDGTTSPIVISRV